MTEADVELILAASKPVPLIMLQCGMPRSAQEKANEAWEKLGKRMGFDYMTVRPIEGKCDRFFSAVPSETESQRKEREAKEAEEKTQAEITILQAEIEKCRKALENWEKVFPGKTADQVQTELEAERDKNAWEVSPDMYEARIDLLSQELKAYREGGITEEILRRNDGFIKVGRGCAIVSEALIK